jgi:elongation factor G
MEARAPLAALAFKVQLWDGRRHVFARIYRGSLAPGDSVAIPRAGSEPLREHAARVFDVDAGKRSRLDRAYAGQIVLLAGLRYASTGDSLCDPEAPLVLERIDAREPVLSLAIEPSSADSEKKLLEVLDKLEQEDPTLQVLEDAETGQRLLRGMGELHLQMVLERMQREFQLEVRAGRPRVALRETVAAPAEGEDHFQRLLEVDRGQSELRARARVGVRPLERRAGVRVLAEPRLLPEGAALAPLQVEAVQQGARDLLESGPLEGAPLQDLEIRVLEVELFGAASSPEALRAAVSRALRRALQAAGGVLLRPIMRTEVVVPEENLGAVLGDLQARQALILDTEDQGATHVIHCDAALDRLLGYTTELRSLTHGRGQFSMEFDRFDQA